MNKSFSLDIKKFKNKVKGRAKATVQKICLDVDRGLVLSTPVDTGRARGGWNVGVNAVNLEKTTEDPSGQNTIAENEALILSRVDYGDKIFISNNVPYITYLNDGSSKQAPNGMVEKTLQRYPQIVRISVDNSKRENP